MGAAFASTVSQGMSGPSPLASITVGTCERAGRRRGDCGGRRRIDRAEAEAVERKCVSYRARNVMIPR
jgi:hypothetical protein